MQQEIDINSLAKIILDISGSNSIIQHEQERIGDIKYSLCCNRKLVE